MGHFFFDGRKITVCNVRILNHCKFMCLHSQEILTLCILMDFPIQIHRIRMGLFIIYFKGSQVEYSTNYVLQSPKIVFIIANSAGPDEMQHYAAF